MRSSLILAAALQLLACGPGTYAPQRVAWYLNNRDQIWLPVEKSDFARDRVNSATPTVHGSELLQSATQLEPGVARIVIDCGVPDAVRVKWTGSSDSVKTASRFELAYLDAGEIVFFDPAEHRFATSLVSVRSIPSGVRTLPSGTGSPPPGVGQAEAPLELHGPPERPYSRRAMDQAERVAIDPDMALRIEIERWARVLRVGRAVVLQLRESDVAESARAMAPGFSNSFVTVAVTPASARLFGESPGQPGRYIAWVDPAGSAKVLEVGWRIVAIEGESPDSYDKRPNGAPVEFALQRDGVNRTVRVTPERWPLGIHFIVLPVSNRTAFAARNEAGAFIGIPTPFLDLLKTDDMLAVTLGHEVAHVALGHLAPPSPSAQFFRAGWMLTAGILSPPLAAGVLNRFERDKERSADIAGLRLAHGAGYDSAAGVALVDVFAAHLKVDAVTQFLATHPPYDERRLILQEEARRLEAESAGTASEGEAASPD